jgi:hypothetical protein
MVREYPVSNDSLFAYNPATVNCTDGPDINELAPEYRALVIVDCKPIAGVPLKQVRKPGWQLDWAQTVTETDLDNLIALKQPWHYFKAVCPPGLTADFQQRLFQYGLTAYVTPFQPEAHVNLSDGWDAYWQTRKHNHKRDMQRRMNKLNKTGFHVHTIQDDTTLRAMLALFFEWHQSYWHARQVLSQYASPEAQNRLTAWLSHALQENRLWGKVLIIDNQPAAISFGMVEHNQVYSLLSAYHQAFSDYSPGSSLLYLELQHAATANVHTFRLGPGENFQKSRWQTDTLYTQTLFIPNPTSTIGRLAIAYKLLTRLFKPKVLAASPLHDDKS